MRHEYLTNLPLEEAVSGYLSFLDAAGMHSREETVPVQEAFGRMTAHAVYAALCSPHYNACAMDGIALDARITFGTSETTPVILSESDFIRVDTGDPLPEGCDAVVMIEDVVETENGIRLYAPAIPWQHVRQIGEDICAGDMLLPSYTRITPAAVGALLAGGISEVSVLAKPIVGILPTGDEIVPPSADPKAGEVMEFNSAIFSGMVHSWGAEAHILPIVPDDREQIKAAILDALARCDCLLIGAGTSAGRDDYTPQLLRELGEVFCHGIAIKPGKPAVLARIGTKPVLGVPGYPVSGILVLEHLLQPVLGRLLQQPQPVPDQVDVTLGRRVTSSLKYREFVRARVSPVNGALCAVPLGRGAGVVTSFVKADAILDIPQNSEGYEAGTKLRVRLLRPKSEIDRTLSIVGSHDPLIDEAADLLRREDPSLSIASSHVGSLGGVLAVKRGEAILAGTHLLDPDGGYNRTVLKQYFPDDDAVLLRCVGRVQGILTASGNPHSIKTFSDLRGLRYVNRQNGAGTRLLCDQLLKQAGMTPSELNGYTREEFTHTAVAAQIAGGTADAGLGILAAAKLYGLGFVPVCNEEYDLLILKKNLDLPLVQRFLAVLQSDAFRLRLEALGGYALDGTPGEILTV